MNCTCNSKPQTDWQRQLRAANRQTKAYLKDAETAIALFKENITEANELEDPEERFAVISQAQSRFCDDLGNIGNY